MWQFRKGGTAQKEGEREREIIVFYHQVLGAVYEGGDCPKRGQRDRSLVFTTRSLGQFTKEGTAHRSIERERIGFYHQVLGAVYEGGDCPKGA